jgi:hypothetical protein
LSFDTSGSLFGPCLLRLAGGMGGIWFDTIHTPVMTLFLLREIVELSSGGGKRVIDCLPQHARIGCRQTARD